MRIIFCLLASLFCALNASAQKFDTGNTSIEVIYSKAKREFAEFEKDHGGFIKTSNVNMHYLAWGKASDPCLIWVHGSMNNGYELVNIADNLVRSGFYVIAIDYYGHGQTPIPEHEVSLYHIADDIKVLMDSLSISKAFVGGFSRGGYVATAFYDSYPDRALGLILEDGGSVAANTFYHKMSQQDLIEKAQLFDSATGHAWDSVYNSELEIFEALYNFGENDNPFTMFALIKKDTSEKWSFIYPKMMGLFHLMDSLQFLDLTLRPTKIPLFAQSMVTLEPKIVFRNLKVPVLIFDPVSEQDPMPFEEENQELQKQHPNFIEYIVYNDTEHNIHYEHPGRFANDVINFMKKAL